MLIAALGVLFLIFFFTSECLGTLNYCLNKKRSTYVHLEVKGFLFYLIPKQGIYNDVAYVNGKEYKNYRCVIIMSIIHYILTAIALLLLLLFYFLSIPGWVYICIIPISYMVLSIIVTIILLKKSPIDSNPFY